MKKTMTAVAVAVATAAFAQFADRPMPERGLKMTGGWVDKPGTPQGEIACVNCQGAAQKAWIEEGIAALTKQTRFRLTLADGQFDVRSPKLAGKMSIFIVDDPALPMSLVAPEARWAAVNVAKLKSEKEPFFRARVRKELVRTFAMLCGGCRSNYQGTITEAVSCAEELDAQVNENLPLDVVGRFTPHLNHFGVSPRIVTTYLVACNQGWAPAPTNEYQKAIWDKVHELPRNPMQIKFDPKKDK